jgi:hypothetical protein
MGVHAPVKSNPTVHATFILLDTARKPAANPGYFWWLGRSPPVAEFVGSRCVGRRGDSLSNDGGGDENSRVGAVVDVDGAGPAARHGGAYRVPGRKWGVHEYRVGREHPGSMGKGRNSGVPASATFTGGLRC